MTTDSAFGNKTPDAEIDGLVHDFKYFDVPNNVDQKVYNHIISPLSRSNAPGVTFNIKGNGAQLSDVNKGLQDVRNLIDNTGDIPAGMAEKIGLIRQNGTVSFLTKDQIINGASF